MVSGTKKQQEDKKLILNGTPYRIRTCDLRLRRPLLYPAELRAPWEASASRSETPGIIRSTSVESIHFARKLRGLYDAGEISLSNCTRSIPPELMRAKIHLVARRNTPMTLDLTGSKQAKFTAYRIKQQTRTDSEARFWQNILIPLS